MEPVRSPRDFDVALARLRRRRRLTFFLFPVLLILLTLGADTYLRRRRQTRALQAAANAWDAYARCALGAPLGPHESPTTRLSRIELNLPEVRRSLLRVETTAATDWPARCAYHLDELHEALVRGRLLQNKRLAYLDEVALAARTDIAPAHMPDLADHLWASLAEAGLPPAAGAPASHDPPAPEPARPLTAATLPPLPVEVQAPPEEADRVPGIGLRLSFAPPSGDSDLCSFRPDDHGAPFRTAHCADNVVPTATDDATPGFVRNVKGRFDRFELIRPQFGEGPQVLSMPSGITAIALFGDELVWVAGRHLFARNVPQGPAELGATNDLGEVQGTSAELTACRTETSLVIRVRSYDDSAGPRGALATVALLTASAWERAPEPAIIQADAEFTCRGREATFTWLESDVIHQARCTPSGCKAEDSEPLALPWESGRPDRVSDVDGRAILVGIGMTAGPVVAGSVKTVRMRVAPVADIARAPDIVMLGDRAHDGVDVTDVRVYVRGGAALVLVVAAAEKEPYRAIEVGADGKFEGLKVEKL